MPTFALYYNTLNMPIAKYLLCFFLIFVATFLTAQDFKTEWGKVSQADLEMKSCSFDEDADAMILHDIGDLQFRSTNYGGSVLKRHKRIKVFNKEGFNNGNFEVSYFSYNGSAKVKEMKVQVFSPSGEITKLSKNEIFTEEVSKYISKLKFAAPNIEAGSIIEYSYNYENVSLIRLVDWYFQDEIPTRLSKLKVEYPLRYNYLSLTHSQQLFEQSTSEGSQYGNVSTTINEFIGRNIEAFKDEAYVASKTDNYARVQFQLKSGIYIARRTEIFTNWQAMREFFYESENIGSIIRHNSGKKVLEKITLEENATDKDKMLSIFNYIKENTKWNKIEAIAAKQNVAKLINTGKGNTADINYALINILQKAGLDAFPILTNKREFGKCIEFYPIVDQFTFVFAGVIINDKIVLLDATHKLNAPNLINKKALNNRGWFFTKHREGWLDIIPGKSSVTTQEILNIDEAGNVTGEVKIRSKGYYAIDDEIKDADEQVEYLKKEYGNNASITDYAADSTKISKPQLDESLQLSINNYCKKGNDMLYMNPVLIPIFEENPFKSTERKSPIDFHYPKHLKYISNFTIPKGYVVESLPEKAKMQLGDKYIQYSYGISNASENLQLVRKFDLNIIEMPAEFYQELKAFMEQIVRKEKEQVVLRKVN